MGAVFENSGPAAPHVRCQQIAERSLRGASDIAESLPHELPRGICRPAGVFLQARPQAPTPKPLCERREALTRDQRAISQDFI